MFLPQNKRPRFHPYKTCAKVAVLLMFIDSVGRRTLFILDYLNVPLSFPSLLPLYISVSLLVYFLPRLPHTQQWLLFSQTGRAEISHLVESFHFQRKVCCCGHDVTVSAVLSLKAPATC
jgi:hypothetical protein